MNDSPDRRVQKTRSALLSAFLELLLEVGYDKLNVAGVAALANVGRSTCYEHYRTKRDLLKASVSVPFARLADLADPQANHSLLPGILRHFREQNHLARALLNGPPRPIMSTVLAGLILERLKKRGLKNLLIAPEIMARQLADAQLALLEVWVVGRPACELESMVQALQRTTNALIDSLFAT